MQLLQALLPVLGLVVVAASGVAHAVILLKHRPDHHLLIDSFAEGVAKINGIANPTSAPQAAAAPDAGSTP